MKIILLLISICLCSCALFKKTSKTTDVDLQSSNSELKSSQLVLKRADKETQIFTYWNDSGYYQYQHIKEQVDQAKSAGLTVGEQAESKQTTIVKKSKPEFIWFIISGVIIFIICFLPSRKGTCNK